MSLYNAIKKAQMLAAEDAVIEDLVAKGLIDPPVSSMQREIERLREEAANFHVAYRAKCDQETKAQAVEINKLRAIIAEFVSLYDQRLPLRERPDLWAAARETLMGAQ